MKAAIGSGGAAVWTMNPRDGDMRQVIGLVGAIGLTWLVHPAA